MFRQVSSALMLVTFLAGAGAPARAQSAQSQRQAMLADLLRDADLSRLANDRATCAAGNQPRGVAKTRAAGGVSMPDASDYCVTVLTRLARSGALPPLRDATTSGLTPAVAFDAGFSAGYNRGGALPATLPTMAGLKPGGEQCLAQAEPNPKVCYATGYAFGLRAAHGEAVRVQ